MLIIDKFRKVSILISAYRRKEFDLLKVGKKFRKFWLHESKKGGKPSIQG